MASVVPDVIELAPEVRRRARVRTITEPAHVRYALIFLGLAFLTVVVVLPLGSVFAQAWRRGWGSTCTSCSTPRPGPPSS
jgi:ABC-type sulfate transport system permease subunit